MIKLHLSLFFRSGFRSLIYYTLYLLPFSSNSQDTVQANKPLTFFLTEKSFDKGSFSPVDTSIDSYHYFPAGFKHNYKTLGNTGSPGQTMYYANPKTTGFSTGINFMDIYVSKKEEIPYFNTRRPYSKVFFLMGSKDEQMLNVKHTQNIGKQFNFGLDYTNLTSTGFYQKQKTRSNDFHFQSHYEAKNRFYGIFGNFIYNKMTVEENGGLFNDIYFEYNLVDRKDAIPVNLQNASNISQKKSIYFKQYINLGKREDFFDLTDSVNRKVISPFVRLAHTFSFEKQINSYKDESPDSLQYLNLFNYEKTRGPMGVIKDSLNVKIFENTISLGTVDFTELSGKHYGFKNFYASVFIKNQNIERLTHNDNFDTTFYNIMAGADMSFRFLKMFSAGGSAIQVVNGFNNGDNYFKGFLEFTPGLHFKDTGYKKESGSVHHIRIETFHQVKHPDWIYTHYFSDQLNFRYDFFNSTYSGQSASYHNEKWKINIGASQNFFKNPIYFAFDDVFTIDTVFVATGIIPQQREKRITINQAYFSKQFKLWKFHLNTNLYYQETSNEVILPFPELITYNSFYFESLMLRKSLLGQIGVDFYYHTGYYANAYSPFLKLFYLQYEKQVGNYPFFDFFINFKIKSVRAFFKITHFNSGFSGNAYYLVPHYPQPDRAFHFGIDWRFID